MEQFTKLFGGLLALVYHCFDRIVIRCHLPLLTRPENIVHFFRDVHGVGAITKEVLRQRTTERLLPSLAFTRRDPSGFILCWVSQGTRGERFNRLSRSGVLLVGGGAGITDQHCANISANVFLTPARRLNQNYHFLRVQIVATAFDQELALVDQGAERFAGTQLLHGQNNVLVDRNRNDLR